MAESTYQKQIMNTLADMKKSINTLQFEMKHIVQYIEDTRLTSEERKQLAQSISKIKSGDHSDFVSWKKGKKMLGM